MNENDIKMAIDCAVDAVGLVFYPPTPKSFNLDTALALNQKSLIIRPCPFIWQAG